MSPDNWVSSLIFLLSLYQVFYQKLIFVLYLFYRHEDGTLRFWDVSQVDMQLMYSLNTAKLFVSDHEGHDNGAQEVEEEGWPPFKKVGNYDPFTDDPRFAIQKVLLCANSKTLVVAGNGGQVLMFGISDDDSSVELQVRIL